MNTHIFALCSFTDVRDGFAGDCLLRHPVAWVLAPGLTAVFSLYVGRFRRSRKKRRRNEGRPRRGGSRSARDRLASRVSWSGVGAPGTPARGRRMVDRTSARPNAVARVSQQGGWIPAISLECPSTLGQISPAVFEHRTRAMDAAVPVDAKTASTSDLENRTYRGFPQRPQPSSLSTDHKRRYHHPA